MNDKKQRLDELMATIQSLMAVYRELAEDYDYSELKKIPRKLSNFRRIKC